MGECSLRSRWQEERFPNTLTLCDPDTHYLSPITLPPCHPAFLLRVPNRDALGGRAQDRSEGADHAP
jgi:hypothetical protein